MIAIILAGGLSKRLHPITINEPKCLLEIDGETMVSRYIRLLEKVGIEKTLIVTGFNHDAVMAEAKCAQDKMEIEAIYNEEYKKDDNHPIDGFLLTKEYCNDDFLLLNSDIYFTEKILRKLVEYPKSSVVVDSSAEFIEREMFVDYTDDMQVTEISKFLEKRDLNQGKSVQIVKVLKEDADTVYTRSKEIAPEDTVFYPAQAFDTLIANNKFFAIDVAGQFSHELDTVDDYHSLMSHIEDGTNKS